jgi:hypothetical protein
VTPPDIRSRLPRSIGNGNQCASLISLTLACAAESKSMPIVVSLSGSIGTRSRRNFHRPESNCGIALNSAFRVLIVFPRWLRLQIRAPRQSTATVPQPRKKCSNLSFQESHFSSCRLSQAFEDRHFRKFECERYETEDSNKHRQGKQRSDLAELIRNVMRSQDDEVTCNVSREEPVDRNEADNIRRAGCCAKHG